MGIQPIYVFSLPRCGSTLLQRIIDESDYVGTTAEPWLLLPLLSIRREGGTYADYGFNLARRAIRGFKDELRGGPARFDEELERFVLRLYEQAAPSRAQYFLDKTPRYHVISSSILDCFRNAKAIVLWRNPLSYVASMMETWAEGRWNLYRYTLDLYQGLDSLVKLCREDRGNVLQVSYESLVLNPDQERTRVAEFLDIDLPGGDAAPSTVQGELGDPTQDRYDTISKAPLRKWRKTLQNPIRKTWMKQYLDWIGSSRLETMGYDRDELRAELEDAPSSNEHLASDVVRWSYGKLYQALELEIMVEKVSLLRKGIVVPSHR